jgi:hypothetical protein
MNEKIACWIVYICIGRRRKWKECFLRGGRKWKYTSLGVSWITLCSIWLRYFLNSEMFVIKIRRCKCVCTFIYIYDMMFIQMYNYQYVCLYLLIVVIWICWCIFIFILLNVYICICKLDPFYWVLLFIHISLSIFFLKKQRKRRNWRRQWNANQDIQNSTNYFLIKLIRIINRNHRKYFRLHHISKTENGGEKECPKKSEIKNENGGQKNNPRLKTPHSRLRPQSIITAEVWEELFTLERKGRGLKVYKQREANFQRVEGKILFVLGWSDF